MNVSKMQKRTVFVVKSRRKLLSRRAVLAMFDIMVKYPNKYLAQLEIKRIYIQAPGQNYERQKPSILHRQSKHC